MEAIVGLILLLILFELAAGLVHLTVRGACHAWQGLLILVSATVIAGVSIHRFLGMEPWWCNGWLVLGLLAVAVDLVIGYHTITAWGLL